jgi:hypothetical protein
MNRGLGGGSTCPICPGVPHGWGSGSWVKEEGGAEVLPAIEWWGRCPALLPPPSPMAHFPSHGRNGSDGMQRVQTPWERRRCHQCQMPTVSPPHAAASPNTPGMPTPPSKLSLARMKGMRSVRGSGEREQQCSHSRGRRMEGCISHEPWTL